MLIRDERETDHAAVHAVNAAAFPTPLEADLVDALRRQAHPLISLVAESNGTILGHILFSPVTLDGRPDLRLMGLAPMAVTPEHQSTGIGSALVRAGLAACKEHGFSAVVVLGHPEYYPRFGFAPAVRWGLRSEYDVPDEVFMALELVPGALRDATGTIKYHEAFGSVA